MFDATATKAQFEKALEVLHKDLSSLRTGRANASLVENLMVEYYGVPTPLIQVASITSPDPRSLMISPWDKKAIPGIEKAILKADHLGFSPIADKDVVRINIPALTEERRKELSKVANEKGEAIKVEVRRIRDDARNEIKSAEKSKEITEDDKFAQFEELDNLTKEYSAKIDESVESKKSEIMSV